MIEAEFDQASLFKKLIDAIKDQIKSCNFDYSDTGISVEAMDESHIALVSLFLGADGFNNYRCDHGAALGINVATLAKVLRCANNEDKLTLVVDESTKEKLTVTFEDKSQDRISEYQIKLMNIDQEQLAIPEQEYDATITMPAVEFQRICRDLQSLSEFITISAIKDEVRFSCEGEDSAGTIVLKPTTNIEDPTKSVKVVLAQPVEISLALKYLLGFTKAGSLSDTVTLRCLDDNPIMVEYTIASGYIRFFLAPRIAAND